MPLPPDKKRDTDERLIAKPPESWSMAGRKMLRQRFCHARLNLRP